MSTGERREKSCGHAGTLVLATVLGVGIGLLAAPQAGTDTRRALRRRIADVGDDLDDGLEELQERGGKARRALRDRAAQLRRRGRKRREEAMEELEDIDEDVEDVLDEDEEDEGSSALPTILTVGAGLAAVAYLLASERAAPARERVREAAATVRDEAEARWDWFQRRGENGHPTSESGTRIDTPGSAPQAS
jgi:gas vesicle protein